MKENYNWKFVVSALVWLGFMIGSAQAQTITDTVYLFQDPSGSGTFTSSAVVDTSEVKAAGSSSGNTGFMSFDISGLPSNAYVIGIDLEYYVNGINWPYWSLVPLGVDPDTATTSQMHSNMSPNVYSGWYAYRNESSSAGTGWVSLPLDDPTGASTSFPSGTPGDAVADLNTQIASGAGWFGVGYWSRDFGTTYYIEADGWNETNEPFLIIQYQLANCTLPTGLTVTSFTDTSVTLSWTAGDPSTVSWVVEYGPAGFTIGTGTQIEISSNPYTVTGLSGNTDYSFYVADSCASTPGTISPMAGPVSQKTACSIPTAPWSESFDALANFDDCWTHNYTANSNVWRWFVTGGTGSTGWPNYGVNQWPDHTGNSGGYVFWDGSYWTQANPAAYQSPLVDVSGLTDPSLSFYYMSNNTNYPSQNNTLYVNFYDGSTWHDSIWSFAGNLSDWALAVVDLSAYTISGAVQFEVVGDGNTYVLGGTNTSEFYNDLLVDDVAFQEAPPCPIATDLTLDTVTAFGATISWSNGSTSAAGWQVVVGAPGSDPDSLTPTYVTTNPYSITGLNPVTTYSVWIREECSPGVYTWWTGPVNFTTECAPFLAPYLNTFDEPVLSLYCWTSIDSGTSTFSPKAWRWYTPTGTGSTGFPGYSVAGWPEHTGNGGGYIFWDGSYSSPTFYANYIYESPAIDLQNLTSPEIRFYYMAKWDSTIYTSGGHNTLYVDLWDGAAWQDSIWGFQGSVNDWTEAIIDISSYTFTGDIKVRLHIDPANFSAIGTPYNYYHDILIDDFRVTDPPPCANPSGLMLNTVTNNMADLSWIAGSAGASSWDVVYGAPGFNPDTATSYVTASTNVNYQVTGLTGNTTYHMYVREHCITPSGSYSWWIGPITVNTKCDPITAPYLQEFNFGTTLTAPDIPQCWETYQDSPTVNSAFPVNPLWRTHDPVTWNWPYPQYEAYQLPDHTGNGGGYAWMDHGWNKSKRVVFESPLFDITGLSNPNIQFFLWRNNAISPSNNMAVNVDVWDGTTWHDTVISNYIGNDTSWIEVNILLNQFITPGPTAPDIAFKIWVDMTAAGTVSYYGDILIDDIAIDEAPPCPNPGFLTTTSVSDTSIAIKWNKGNPESIAHYMVVDTMLIDPDTVSNLNPTFDFGNYLQGTQFDTIMNTDGNTTYYIWIRELCPDATFSEWIGPMAVTTYCNPIMAPYSEGFENTSGIYWSGTTIPDCWRNGTGDDHDWQTHSGWLSYSAPNANEGSRYLFGYNPQFVLNSGDSAVMYLPDFSLDSMTKPVLQFDFYRSYPGSTADLDGEVVVQVWDKSQSKWVDIWSRVGGQGSLWLTFAVDLQAYANYDRVKLRFITYAGAYYSYYYRPAIDHVRIVEGPDCWQPSNLSVLFTSGNSATLGWVPNDPSATQWVLAYGPPGEDPDTSAFMMYDTVTTAGTHTLTNLSGYTNYVVYVAEFCPGGAGTKSWWEGPAAFLTPILPPYLETFDDPNNTWGLPENWYETRGKIANPTTFNSSWSYWGKADFGNNPTLSRSLYAYWYYFSTAEEWVITPPIDLGYQGNWNLFFDFALTYGSTPNDTTYLDANDTINVVISTDGGLTWNKYDQILLLDTFSFISPVGQLYQLPLTSYTGTVKFGFYLQSDSYQNYNPYYRRIFVDNVRVDEPPACANPTNLSVQVAGGDYMELLWDVGSTSNNEWEVQFKDKFGFTSTYTVYTNNPIITGLQDNMCYEIQVREACSSSPGDYSWWTNPLTGCTAILPPWIETFDNYTSFFTWPDGWSETDGYIANPSNLFGTFSSWSPDDFINNSANGRCARMNIYSSFPKEWLMTPPIDLGAGGAWSLEFDYAITDWPSSNPINEWGYDDTVHVVISDDGGQSWWRSNAVWTLDSAGLPTTTNVANHVSVPLDMFSGTIMVGFYTESTVSNSDNDFFIDNVEIRGPEVTCDDFDGYQLGTLDGQGTIWNSWTGSSGLEDTEVSDDFAFSGSYSMKVHESGTNGTSDIVTAFGEGDTTGIFEVSFAFLQPSGYGGYFNIMHDYDGSNSVWALEVYMDGNNGVGTVYQGTTTLGTFSFTPGNWTPVNIVVDLDNDEAELIVNGLSNMTWQWSGGNSGSVYKQIDACNMYSAAPSGLTALTYFDDVCVGDFAPNCVINTAPTVLDITVDCNDEGTFTGSAGTTGNFVIWTDSLGNFIGTGSSLTVGPLTEDLSVNALEATTLGGQLHIGMEEGTTTNGAYNLFTSGMYFTVYRSVRWDSVTVDADGALEMQVVVYTDEPTAGGVELFRSAETPIAGAGVYQIPVDLILQPGTYYVNVERTSGSGNLFRTSDGATYPYVIPNLMTIDSVNAINQFRWYYIFDWVINEVCIGTDPTMATAVVLPTADAQAVVNTTPPTPTEMVVNFDGSGSNGTNHTWTIDGQTYTGATAQHTFTANGTYSYLLTVEDECGNIDTYSADVIVAGIGIEDLTGYGFDVYPNPNNGVFELSFNSVMEQAIDIRILNTMGQIVFEETLDGFSGEYNNTIDISREAVGVYTLQVITEEGTHTERISVQ
jgi:hypothetical protein